ncbi:hypothetical protein EJ02DRAFT_404607 [Clathrospora elynae]|uniref:Glycosyl transferase CAP10 domain-containing protein n=1 Tax=Clathrospora elynae TaxID=706981 RepID=A0A6A5SMK8_9PLEO|nr:hypothetical protein EJ02DRAFT_404607 [Clathrospora elynae]
MFRRCAHCVTIRNIVSVVTGLGVFFICSNILLLWKFQIPLSPTHGTKLHGDEPNALRTHPIDTLMANAETSFQTLISEQTTTLHSAAEAYRQRRGRHPPPYFDAWFEYATKHEAVILESLFDQVHHDLNPFWGVPAKDMRDFARHFENHIYVRNRTVKMTMNHSQGTGRDRMEAWLDTMKSIEGFLPDLDMAINVMDESRVIVPWEDISKYVQSEKKIRTRSVPSQVISQYQTLDTPDEESGEPPQVDWIGPEEPYWDTARVGCAPQAPARYEAAATGFTGPPLMPPGYPMRSFQGYVKNWTFVRDPCQQRHLQEAHGTFIEPVSVSTTRALVPIFGESKLSMNNDILIPPAAYLSESFASGEYSDANAHGGNWPDKITGAVWRGVASGGRNREENWTRFHRHRFVSMLNGTYVQSIETSPEAVGEGQNFILQSYATYRLAVTKYMDLGTWLDRITDIGFTDLLCFPTTDEPTCNYTDPYYSITSKMPMSEQYDYKFLPDIDGNSFSGRYLSFLRSTSVPIKATIYSEWHDDRLIPWLHFVPMDNLFVDVYGIMDYFLGTGADFKTDGEEVVTDGVHDEAAKKIALRGQEWANKVLRKEDMQIYMLRLLLEYARLCDDNREKLGFVGDLKSEDSDLDRR